MIFQIKPDFDRQGGQSAYSTSERSNMERLLENASQSPKGPMAPPPPFSREGRKNSKGKTS